MTLFANPQLFELKKAHVKEFLLTLRQDNVKFTFDRSTEPRNKQTLVKFGFFTKDVYNVIRNLEYIDYSAGPEPNNSQYAPKFFQDGDIWKFGKVLESLEGPLEVYIKICFKKYNESSFVACISFHEPESTIYYPFQQLE